MFVKLTRRIGDGSATQIWVNTDKIKAVIPDGDHVQLLFDDNDKMVVLEDMRSAVMAVQGIQQLPRRVYDEV